MSFLSSIDMLAKEFGFTEAQKNWLIASIIIGILAGFVVIAWLIYNCWVFLYKQGRYKVLPLTVFYILSISVMAAHIIVGFAFAPTFLEARVMP